MDNLLMGIGEEALRSYPIAIGFWVCVLLGLGFAGYKMWEGEDEPSHQNWIAAGTVAVLLVWVWFGNGVWTETKDLCRDLRGTEQWSEQKCNAIDPEGSPFRSSTTP